MATRKRTRVSVPGVPSSEAPTYEEPTDPRGPLPPKPDQAGPGDPHRRPVPPPACRGDGRPAGRVPDDRRTGRGCRTPTTRCEAGPRGPTLLQDHHLREKISHFDHERIPERVVHARGAGAHGVFVANGAAEGICRAAFLQAGVETPVFVRFSTVLGLARLGRPRPRHPRVRDPLLHRRGQLRPGRQQHPGVLHPGRHQVPRRHPRRQAAPGPRDPAGAERARHVLGLRLAAHRGPGPHDVEHVRPGAAALLPDDGGLRRPHLPPGRTPPGDTVPGQVPLEAAAGRALGDVGGGAADQRRRPGLPPPRPRRRHRGRRVTRRGTSACRSCPTARTRRSRASTCSTRPSSCPRSSRPVQLLGTMTLNREHDELLRRDRAGRVQPDQPRAGHRRHQRPAAAGAAVLLPRHPDHPARRAELEPAPDQPRARADQRHAARRLPPGRRARRGRAVPAELARRRLPVRRRAPTTSRSSTCRRRSRPRSRSARTPRRSTTTSARSRCSTAR